jgi:hypothetical protein
MTTQYISRTILFLVCIVLTLARMAGAGDEPSSKASQQWRKDLKRLVILSRLVANRPSLLSEATTTDTIHELSAEPFTCGSHDVSECVLSRLSMVLSQQSAGSSNIFAATQGAAVQINVRRATDVWSKKDIENNWDVLKKWTDALGPAVLLGGAIMLSQKDNGSSDHAAAVLIGSGAGLLLIGNLGTLGQLYGGVDDKQRAQIAKKTINTLQDSEVSRQAYEDSQLIHGLLDSYSTRSEKLLSMISALSDDARDLAGMAASPARSRRIVELCDKTRESLSSFKETAGLANEYAHQLLNLYKRYQNEVALPEDKEKIEDARQIVKYIIDKYYEVIVPFLDGVPEEIEAVQNIKAAILANSIADKQYF